MAISYFRTKQEVSTKDSYFVVHVAGGTATNPIFSSTLIKVRSRCHCKFSDTSDFSSQPYPTIPNHTEPYLTIPNQQSPSITQDLENGADLNNGDTFGEDWALQSWSYQDAVAANQRLASSSYHPVQMQWTRDEGNLTPRTIRNRTDSIFHDFPIDFFEIQPYSTFQNIFLPKTCVLVASSHGVSSINS